MHLIVDQKVAGSSPVDPAMKKEDVDKMFKNSYGDVSETEIAARFFWDISRHYNPILPDWSLLPIEKQDEEIEKIRKLEDIINKVWGIN